MNCKKLLISALLTLAFAASAAAAPAPEEAFLPGGGPAPEAVLSEPEEEIVRHSKIPLVDAALNGDTERIRALLAGGAKPDRSGRDKITPLIAAAFFSAGSEAVQALIDGGANVNAASREGLTPLMCALRAGNTDAAEALLRAGADATASSSQGWTPLMFALRSDSPRPLIEELLGKHANPEARTKGRRTPMMFACQFTDDPGIIELLYSAGAEIALPDDAGDTALHYAARSECGNAPAIIRFLIDNRAELTARNRRGMTPLMVAAESSRRTDVVDELLMDDWRINAKNGDGMTPLMLAAGNPTDAALDIAKRLEAGGADFETTNRYGHTAYLVSLRSAHSPEMVLWLRERTRAHSLRTQSARLTALPPAQRVLAIAEEYAEVLGRWEEESLPEAPLETSPSPDGQNSALEQQESDETDAPAAETQNGAEEGAEQGQEQEEAEPSTNEAGEGQSEASEAAASPAENEVQDRQEGDGVLEEAAEDAEPGQKLDEGIAVLNETAAELNNELTPEQSERLSEVLESMDRESLARLRAKILGMMPESEFDESESPDGEPEEPRFSFPIKAQASDETAPNPSRGNRDAAAALSSISLASRYISGNSLSAALTRKSDELRPFARRRTLKRLRRARKDDPVLIPPLLLAAVNPTEAAPAIIADLLKNGEKLEARDTEGRTALLCAVRYNSSPLAALALLDAGASIHVSYKKSSLRQMLRYNPYMENEDKEVLAAAILKAKRDK